LGKKQKTHFEFRPSIPVFDCFVFPAWKIMANQTVKLRIDGIEAKVEKGKTILEAAQSIGLRIPTLCHDRRLIPFGACRICLVQQEGKSELLPSCFTPAKEGMKITTRSPEILESRRLQLQLILLNHPMVCPRCEKEGECALQTLVYEYGVEETILPWERITFPVDRLSPLLQRDPNRCILCGRCVRICDEVQGVAELSFAKRGIKTTIDTDFHRALDCEFCGQCLDTCPVGAITSDRFDPRTKAWELKETTTPCPYCSCGCRLVIGSKDGEIKRVFCDSGNGPNDGNLCVRGRFGWDFIDHQERISHPLLKVNGALSEVSWEEALRFVALGFQGIREQYGPQAIAGIASSRLTNEEYHLFQKLFREAIGTHQIDHGNGHTYRGLTKGLAKTLGMAASTNSIREIRKADCLLIIGVDPAQTHPIIKNEIHLAIRQNKAQLIVMGCRDIGLTRATQSSPLLSPSISLLDKPGMEIHLINGMIQAILKEGLEDKGFIGERTEGINDLREKVTSLPEGIFPESKKGQIEMAARAFARARRSMILIGSGPWSYLDEEVAIASSNLALITGHVGRESCGVIFLLEKCNSQGAIDMGVFPENEDGGMKAFLGRAGEGNLKALYLVGEDTAVSSPAWRQALEKVSLLIVQDLFMTETARMAHVVLPACSFVEKTGTFTSLERRVQELNPLRPPRGQAKSDFDIFLQLLGLLGTPFQTEAEEDVFEKIGRLVPFYRGIQDGGQWPGNSPFLYAGGFPNGKARLIPVEGKRADRDGDFPFQMVQRPSLFQSGLLSSRSDALKRVSERPCLEISAEDARLLKIEEGEVVRVSTREGGSLEVEAKYSSLVSPWVLTVLYPCSLLGERSVVSVQIDRLK